VQKIGITQRVSRHLYDQPHDCLDQGWVDFLLGLGYLPVPLANLSTSPEAITTYLRQLGLDGLILSGGNDIGGRIGESNAVGSEVSDRRDAFERLAIGWARSEGVPILGVCRGMQLLNVVLGGKLEIVAGHAGTSHVVRAVGNAPERYFAALPAQFVVNSFHNFAVTSAGLAPELISAVVDDAGNVEACAHSREKIVGIMWHPERPSPVPELNAEIVARALARR
jgi:gamma-glutamyl-gamma-aminobutyrate hydrolase PuuD